MKKKPALSCLSLILALVSLAVSILALFSAPEDQSHLIDDLYRENALLRQEIEGLSARLDRQETAAALESFTLSAAAWADSTGADITLTATPAAGVTREAELVVYLNGQIAARTFCSHESSALTATVSLDAADGYSYCLVLGTGQSLPLSSPENPSFEIPVFLAASLSAYCNLTVQDWRLEEGVLTLTDGHAQVQLPRLSTRENIGIASAQLLLRRNGTDAVRMPMELQPSEVALSFDGAIRDLALPVGSLTDGDTLELFLEITLTDGRRLTAFGISWFRDGDQLTSAVG